MFASDLIFKTIETQQLYELAQAYAAATGQKLNTVGRKAARQGLFFERLGQKKDVTSDRRQRIVQYFSDNWPVGVDWPKGGIKRPVKSKPKKLADAA